MRCSDVNLVNKSQCRGGGIVGHDTLKQLIDSKGLSKIGETAADREQTTIAGGEAGEI